MNPNFYPGCHVNRNANDVVKELINNERFMQQVKIEIEAAQLEATYNKLKSYMDDDNITPAQKILIRPEFINAQTRWFNFCCQNNIS